MFTDAGTKKMLIVFILNPSPASTNEKLIIAKLKFLSDF